MMSETFKMDEIDRKIIALVQEQPSLTHTQIAEKVDRSQPTVGMRIRRLEEQGVLQFQAGINLKAADMYFARVDVKTNNPLEIYEIVNKCPFLLNAFRLSGTIEISILMAGFAIEDIDRIVNSHLRSNPNVSMVQVELITDIMKDFVIPFDFNLSKCDCILDEYCWGNKK
ncbi:MAG: Lrp/AsnC family transcriptional regulator [Promethearchaeota archaeon]|nr:MAG: Lrp/AsnC family transcriptional regulator [Candidatus Lokiarchaeota archaeon]